jgi:CCR4-NOT transcription complex subunit 4
MSDNMSITSTNAHSRAGSPPPFTSRVGSAPVRSKTKSQQKKERQERAKLIEQEIADDSKSQSEAPAQEAILSRKKKEKKAKEPKPKPSTPTVEVKPASTLKEAPKASTEAPNKATTEPAARDTANRDAKPAPSVKAPQPAPPVQPTMPIHQEPSPPPTPTSLTPAQIIAEIKANAPEMQKCFDSLFKVTNHNTFKYSPNFTTQRELASAMNWRADFKLNLSKNEVDDLRAGRYPAINYSELHSENNPWERGMVTSSGAHLRALTTDLESRFVELEQALRHMPHGFHFKPGKPQNEAKFSSIDLAALAREYDDAASGGARGGGGNARGPNVMEQMVQDGANLRKGAFLVDEASRYINEFVMPPVTPPPASSSNHGHGGAGKGGKQGSGNGSQGGHGQQHNLAEHAVPSLEVAERQLLEAKRQADEREVALKKQIKKNKRSLALEG